MLGFIRKTWHHRARAMSTLAAISKSAQSAASPGTALPGTTISNPTPSASAAHPGSAAPGSVKPSSTASDVPGGALASPMGPPSAPSNETCVIRGFNADIFFPAEEFESLADYKKRCPPVGAITLNRLITSPTTPLEVNDGWRRLIWTAFIHSHICKKRGDSIVGAFGSGNVGVIKSMGVLGFKELVRTEDAKNDNHEEFKSFVEECLSFKGSSAVNQLPEWADFLQDFASFDEIQLLHHAVFLEDVEAATLFIDLHRLLRHEFRNRGLTAESNSILQDVGCIYTNGNCVSACQGNFLLSELLGSHCPRVQAMRNLRNPLPSGSAVVDVHCIAVSHSIEANLEQNIRAHSPATDLTLLQSYQRFEVIKLLRHTFPRYSQTTLKAFKAHNVWDKIEMERRLQIPSIYYYSHPEDT